MKTLSIDFETRSAVDLRTAGVYVYAEDETTDVWCMAWAFDDEEPALWTPGEPLPARVVAHIQAGGEIRAWNAQFERVIWNHIMVPRYRAPGVRLEQWVCSAAEAAAMALPRSLGEAGAAVGAAQQKDDAGHRLMMRMARPRALVDGRPVWETSPEKRTALGLYCLQDVRTERAIIKSLRRLTPTEREVYLLDQRMNDRGLAFDAELARAAQQIALEGVRRANVALQALTQGAVASVNNHGALREWLQTQGIVTDSVAKPAVAELLEQELPEDVRRVLILRTEAGLSSLAKIDAMFKCVCRDGRIRGLLLYHGASTGRWAGKLVQPQNFPRGSVENPERFVPLILAGDYDAIDVHENPLAVVSSLLRAMLTAAPARTLVAADYSAIEARVVNWIAGQEDILELFRQGKDVYKHNAARLYKIPLEEVQKYPHRQTGKFQELGCGFQMGWKKAVSAAKDQYGLIITDEQAKEIVAGYRESHPKVVELWAEAEEACKRAVDERGAVFPFGAKGRLRATCRGAYLYIILPSGRPLCYASPAVKLRETPWSVEARQDATAELALAKDLGLPPELWPQIPAPVMRPSLSFLAVDNKTGRWGREHTYGGKLVENVVQAIARDLMAEGMLRSERRGFPAILTVHDEVVAEVPDELTNPSTVATFEALLTELPAWADGCPVAAEGWMGFRYRK